MKTWIITGQWWLKQFKQFYAEKIILIHMRLLKDLTRGNQQIDKKVFTVL